MILDRSLRKLTPLALLATGLVVAAPAPAGALTTYQPDLLVDEFDGGPGNDRLNGGPQRDTCHGRGGHDSQSGCEVRTGIPRSPPPPPEGAE